jgi:hypothetical protein
MDHDQSEFQSKVNTTTVVLPRWDYQGMSQPAQSQEPAHQYLPRCRGLVPTRTRIVALSFAIRLVLPPGTRYVPFAYRYPEITLLVGRIAARSATITFGPPSLGRAKYGKP